MENRDKNVRIDYSIWRLLFVKTTELTVKTGKKITIKDYITTAIKEKLESNPNEI